MVVKAKDSSGEGSSEEEKRLRGHEARLDRMAPEGMPSSFVYTGWDVWIASQSMPASVPRLAELTGLEDANDPYLRDVVGFRDRAALQLAARGRSMKGVPFEVVNLGYLPVVQVRGGSFDRRDDDDVPLERQVLTEHRADVVSFGSLYVPDDGTKRAYGLIVPLSQGRRSLRQESFYGPALSAKGDVPTHQLFVGDTLVRDDEYRARTSPLIFGQPGIARLLRSERSYVDLVDRL